MKILSKKIFLFGLLTLVSILILTNLNKTLEKDSLGFKNMLLIGWDGTQRDVLYKLLSDEKLPNLTKVIKEGGLFNIDIITGETETKPGWAEILTGYTSGSLGINSNLNYKPIPKDYTIFERLKDYFGKENIVTVFIGGKINNIGGRGPHKICTNCLTRDPLTFKKTKWWDEAVSAPVAVPGQSRRFEEREGEPYYHTKNNLDLYNVALKEAPNVGKKALGLLEKHKDKRFFMFFHFEEPDEQGHVYGESSKEYAQGIIADDYWLGEIIRQLKKLKIYDKTLIYVTTDHGFDKNAKTHSHAPDSWLAANDPKVKKNGERLDITPTILDRYGINLSQFTPPFDGKSLLGK